MKQPEKKNTHAKAPFKRPLAWDGILTLHQIFLHLDYHTRIIILKSYLLSCIGRNGLNTISSYRPFTWKFTWRGWRSWPLAPHCPSPRPALWKTPKNHLKLPSLYQESSPEEVDGPGLWLLTVRRLIQFCEVLLKPSQATVPLPGKFTWRGWRSWPWAPHCPSPRPVLWSIPRRSQWRCSVWCSSPCSAKKEEWRNLD